MCPCHGRYGGSEAVESKQPGAREQATRSKRAKTWGAELATEGNTNQRKLRRPAAPPEKGEVYWYRRQGRLGGRHSCALCSPSRLPEEASGRQGEGRVRHTHTGQAARCQGVGNIQGRLRRAQKMPARIMSVPAAATAADRAAAAACWLSTARTPSLHTPSSSCGAGRQEGGWDEGPGRELRFGTGWSRQGGRAPRPAWTPPLLATCRTQPQGTPSTLAAALASRQSKCAHRLGDAIAGHAGALHVASQGHGALVLLRAVAGGNQGVEHLQPAGGWAVRRGGG